MAAEHGGEPAARVRDARDGKGVDAEAADVVVALDRRLSSQGEDGVQRGPVLAIEVEQVEGVGKTLHVGVRCSPSNER